MGYCDILVVPVLSKDAIGSEYIPSHIAIIHQYHFRLSTEQKVFWDDLLLFTLDKKS